MAYNRNTMKTSLIGASHDNQARVIKFNTWFDINESGDEITVSSYPDTGTL